MNLPNGTVFLSVITTNPYLFNSSKPVSKQAQCKRFPDGPICRWRVQTPTGNTKDTNCILLSKGGSNALNHHCHPPCRYMQRSSYSNCNALHAFVSGVLLLPAPYIISPLPSLMAHPFLTNNTTYLQMTLRCSLILLSGKVHLSVPRFTLPIVIQRLPHPEIARRCVMLFVVPFLSLVIISSRYGSQGDATKMRICGTSNTRMCRW